jgi:hypothetical protein
MITHDFLQNALTLTTFHFSRWSFNGPLAYW